MNTSFASRSCALLIALGAWASVSLQAANTTVTFANFAFSPKDITIRVGDTVTWSNSGGFHTVTGDGADPFCGTASVPTTCSHTFTLPGTFTYHCVPHQSFGMVGSVTVLAASNAAPSITMTAPGGGAVYSPASTVILTAAAADADGSVAQVEFFLGSTSAGLRTTAPFSLTLSNLPIGHYTASARVTDNLGAQTSSSTNGFTVAPLSAYGQVNLVSDIPGLALHTDPNLVNPWAIAANATGPFWITDNHTGLSTLYTTTGDLQALVVSLPPAAGGSPPSAPTGMIFNSTTNFTLTPGKPALFIFSSEDGTIVGWNAGTSGVLKADASGSGAIYKGLALAQSDGKDYLYATDFHNGKVDVYDGNFAAATLAGGFNDPNLPAGFAPFGIQNIGGSLFVTYARQDLDRVDDVPAPGSGFVDVFDPAGHLLRRFASGDVLNSPWAVVLAPDGFGPMSRALLIGNFGDGVIHGFDPVSGTWLGSINDVSGAPLKIRGLWGLRFGNGQRGGVSSKLYFAAGIPGDGKVEDHGLFGSIDPLAPLQITQTVSNSGNLDLSWLGGTGPFAVQGKAKVEDIDWQDLLTTGEAHASVPLGAGVGFLRVVDRAP